jgi:hypothetical protein
LPDDVLELVLHAAFGNNTACRLPFLATSKLAYRNFRIWGTKIHLAPRAGKRAPTGWLRERKSIRRVEFADSDKCLASLHQWDLDLLQGSAVQELAIHRAVRDLFGGGQFWRCLARLPLTHLSVTWPRISLKGIREALPRLRYLYWTVTQRNSNSNSNSNFDSDSELQHIQGLPLTHLGLRNSENLATLDGFVSKQSFGSLVSLSLDGCADLCSLDALKGMLLTSLDISYCHRLKISNLAALATLPLTHLAYRGCRYAGHLTIVALLGATLRQLDLSYSTIEDADLALLSGLRLRTLSLRGCYKISVAGIAHLEGMSQWLEALYLRDTGIESYHRQLLPEGLRSVAVI